MASITRSKNGLAWVLSWYDANGVRTRKQLPNSRYMSEREAKLIRKAKELSLETGEVIAMPRSRNAMTFAELAKRYVIWRAGQYPDSQEGVERNVNTRLTPFFGALQLEAVDANQVERYLMMRMTESTSDPQTIIKELNTLKAMIKKAISWKLLVHDAVKAVKAPKLRKSKPPPYYNPEERTALLKIKGTYAPAFRLIAFTGMRKQEALNLKRGDVRDGQVHILSTGVQRTKSLKWRAVGLSEAAEQAVAELMAYAPDAGPDAYLLPRINGHSLLRAFKRDAARVGVKRGTIHWLRHTFITLLVQQGVPLRTVQVLAGHSSITVTEKYAHVSPESSTNAARGLKF